MTISRLQRIGSKVTDPLRKADVCSTSCGSAVIEMRYTAHVFPVERGAVAKFARTLASVRTLKSWGAGVVMGDDDIDIRQKPRRLARPDYGGTDVT